MNAARLDARPEKVVCTGPVSSGTRLLAEMVGSWGIPVQHRSMPHWETFWDWDEWPEGTRFVIITRRPDYSTKSALSSGHWTYDHQRVDFEEWIDGEKRDPAPTIEDMWAWWDKAIDVLSDFPNAYWLSYEALIAHPVQQAVNLAAWLGYEGKVRVPTIRDGNKKWQ